MTFEKDIVEYLNNNEFSIEMLDNCRDYFHYRATNDEEKRTFISLMSKKVQDFFPGLPQSIGNIFSKLCLNGGFWNIQDIIFVGNVIFSQKTDPLNPNVNNVAIDYIGSTGNFRYTDTGFIVSEFTNSDITLLKARKLGEELHNIFKQYYNNSYFPKALNWDELVDGCTYIPFAIDCDEKEFVKACVEDKPISFKVAYCVEGTNNCQLLEIAFSPEKEVLLGVIKCDDKNLRLSEIIAKREECMVRTLYKVEAENK